MKKIAFIVIILAVAVFLILPALPHHANKRAQAIWLWSEVQRLQNLGAPPMTLATNREPNAWSKDGFLVFSNGWAAFACHTIHDPDSENIGDIALLRTSDGIIYVSYYHFCCGEWTFDTEDRPRDFSQFLEVYGAKQN
jgi:hypothetical protein